MCVPMLGMVAGLAGSMVSAMGAKSAADGEANQMEYNAKVKKINAQHDRFVGAQKQEEIGAATDKKVSTQFAGYAAGGVDPGYGSATSVIFETEFAGTSDQNKTYIAAESSAVGNENQARDLEAQAKNKRKAGSIAAAGSLLGGLGGAFKSGGSALNLNGAT